MCFFCTKRAIIVWLMHWHDHVHDTLVFQIRREKHALTAHEKCGEKKRTDRPVIRVIFQLISKRRVDISNGWLHARKKNTSTSCRQCFAHTKKKNTKRNVRNIESQVHVFYSFCNKKEKQMFMFNVRRTLQWHKIDNKVNNSWRAMDFRDWNHILSHRIKPTQKKNGLETTKYISKLSDRWPLHPPHNANSWLFLFILFRSYSQVTILM